MASLLAPPLDRWPGPNCPDPGRRFRRRGGVRSWFARVRLERGFLVGRRSAAMTTHCACIVVDRLDGPEGTLYARDHLTRITADLAARAALYLPGHRRALAARVPP